MDGYARIKKDSEEAPKKLKNDFTE